MKIEKFRLRGIKNVHSTHHSPPVNDQIQITTDNV